MKKSHPGSQDSAFERGIIMGAILSLIPSAILVFILCRLGKTQKDSVRFLLKLLGFGALSALVAAGISILCTEVIFSGVDQSSLFFILFENFIIVALVEEGAKFFLLKKGSWNSPFFTHSFNGIVFAAMIALGFGIVENIVYLMFDATITKIIVRGLLGAFGHIIDAMMMGFFYGLAKFYDSTGDEAQVKSSLKKALIVPILFHGSFDALLTMADYTIVVFLFFILYIIEIVLAFKFMKKALRDNQPTTVLMDSQS